MRAGEDVVAEALDRAGLAPGAVVWGPPPSPQAPPPPEGPWVVVPVGAQFTVGAMGRGAFAPYESLWTAEDAVDLAVRLAAAPLPVRGTAPSPEEEQQGRATAAGIADRTAARSGQPGPHRLRTGDRLDCLGPETGHHLYALGTPFPQRSQPPSDVGAAYRTFEVAGPLPPSVREGLAAPWFEQPGGGAMVVLDRPIRWYVDQGLLALR